VCRAARRLFRCKASSFFQPERFGHMMFLVNATQMTQHMPIVHPNVGLQNIKVASGSQPKFILTAKDQCLRH